MTKLEERIKDIRMLKIDFGPYTSDFESLIGEYEASIKMNGELNLKQSRDYLKALGRLWYNRHEWLRREFDTFYKNKE